METVIDVPTFYARFFALGGPPPGSRKPWHYRRRETSLRLEGCQLLAQLVRSRRPRRVLDLGSGITTLLLRHLATEVDDMAVTTTDTSSRWLEVTRGELVRDALPTSRLYLQAEFEQQAGTQNLFGLVSVDAGDLDFRVALAPELERWCAADGILVLDDFGMRDYARQMTAALEGLGFVVTPHHDTLDEYGCYMATAVRRKE